MDIGKIGAQGFDGRGAADNLYTLRFEAILKRGASQR
jgi:hypothetical protein